MKKEFVLYLLVGLLIPISILGCGSTSSVPTSQTVGAAILPASNFHLEGQATTTNVTLPQQFTAADWGMKQAICQQAGYDLTPFAGQDITAIKYGIVEKYSGDSLSLVVLAKDQTDICEYVAANNLIPGIIAVNDTNINIETSIHQYGSLQYTLTSRGVVDRGNIVPITLNVKNTGSGLFEALVGVPEVAVQVVKDNAEVWNPYYGLVFTAIVHQLSIPAGETKKYDFSWDQKDNAGNLVQPGNYTIKTSFLGNTEQVGIAIR